jgi:hypothetical protein
MMTANEQKSPLLVEMTSLSAFGDSEEDLEESEEERQVPPFSTHLEYAQHWWSLLKLPLVVLLANMISFGLAYALVHTTTAEPGVWRNTIWATFTGGLVILATTFGVDAYVAFRGAQFFENQMVQTQEEEQIVKTEQEPSHGERKNNTPVPSNSRPTGFSNKKEFTFLAMSKSVDGMFGCESKAPSSTFLIGLLYAFFAMAVWGAAMSTVSAVYFQGPSSDLFNLYDCFWHPLSRYDSMWYSGDEYPISSLQELPNFQNLPVDVQNWIIPPGEGYLDTQNQNWVDTTPTTESLPYVELLDGSIAFSYMRTGAYSTDSIEEVGVAMFAPNGSGVASYLFNSSFADGQYQRVQLFGFPRTPPYHGWCGISATTDPVILQDEVLCYGNGTFMQFPGMKGEQEMETGWSGTVMLFVTDDSLWVAKRKDESGRKDESSKEHHEIVLSLTSYSIANKERAVVLEATHLAQPDQQSAGPLKLQRTCYRPFLTVSCSSLPVLVWLSFYLYQRDVPSSLVPMGISCCLILGWMLPSPWNSIVALLVASICTCSIVTKARMVGVQGQETLWTYVSTEMLIWAQYSLMGGVVTTYYFTEWINTGWLELSDHEVNVGSFVMVPCLTFVVAALNAICLNHPVFELLAGAFALLGLGAIPMFVFKGAIGLTLPPLFLTLCLGCLGIGRICRSCRLHTKVYCHRGWHHLRTTRGKGYEYVSTKPADQSIAAF